VRLAHNLTSFLRQSYLPVERPDNVSVGFAPYFLDVVLLAVLPIAAFGWLRWRTAARSARALAQSVISVGLALGLVVFGYFPAFVTFVVKSQRAFFGDLFLVIVLVFTLRRLVEKGWVGRTALWSGLALLLCASDFYYLSVVLSVDHTRRHWPRFDYDLS